MNRKPCIDPYKMRIDGEKVTDRVGDLIKKNLKKPVDSTHFEIPFSISKYKHKHIPDTK